MKKYWLFVYLCCGGCTVLHNVSSPSQQFMAQLSTLCGQVFEGRVVSDDPQDDNWRKEKLIAGPVDCQDNIVFIPLAVGTNTSRTWIIKETSAGLSLHHRHLHADGTPDAVTNYGGTALEAGSLMRQEFPVDAASIDLFNREGLTASVTNIWALEVKPQQKLSYELSRDNRYFRADFDLSQPLTLGVSIQ